jgi:NAD(P)-dependent dehydrogenase (short-subunit alcohol dehydrogenase family)
MNYSEKRTTRRDIVLGGTAALAGIAATAIHQPEPSVAQQSSTAPQALGELAGQVAFVTGAARGIGRAIAIALAQAGADIAATDILADIPGHPIPLARTEDITETKRLVEQVGRRCLTLKADTRDLSSLRAAVTQTNEQLGAIDIVIANAGVNSNVGFISEDEQAWQNHWDVVTDVNIRGTANTLRVTLPSMVERQAGRIVIISSTFGRQGNGANPAYVTSKWGLIGLTKAAAIESGSSGVTVNAIAPTAVRTGLGGPQTQEQQAQSDEWLQANYHQLPVGLLEPEDIAGAVVFLVSPAARHMTGTVLDVAAGANARYTA